LLFFCVKEDRQRIKINLKQDLFELTLAITSALAETDVFPAVTATANAFTAADMASLFESDAGQSLQLAALSAQEMRETEGAVAPLVYVGVMTGSRFIAQRLVTQRVAQNLVSRGATNILAPNR